MKKTFTKLIAVAAAIGLAASAFAQTYPYTNPTYIPTAVAAPASLSAPGDYTFQTNDVQVASLRVTGTCTNLAATVQGTNDTTNWTDLPIATAGGGTSTVAISTTGFWKVNASGYTRLRVHVTALTAACTFAMAGTGGPQPIADLCSHPGVAKSSIVLNQGASATTKVIEAVTGKSIYVCGFVASAAGTTPTFTFISGTKTTNDCDTGAANLSGAIVPSATTGTISFATGSTVMSAGASKQLCMTTAATTSVQGILTYVQQ